MTEDDFPDALPSGHRLHWYVLERVLGQGGFGITYLAHDSNLDRRVAIKEYLPAEVARRRADASARPRTESHAERFAWGLERFLAEARTLARFDHPNIVRVLSIFEANNTAYMVMRFEEGEDLGSLLERRGTLPERDLMACLLPILEGLQLIHSSGFIHRDIKPENIYMRDDGSPVLLDFGSARQSFGSAKTMTILVAPGYAPLEQYYGDAKTQGPWTDIYGLGATCYRAIAGRAPLDAVARAKGVLGSTRDLLEPAAVLGRGSYDERLLIAIDHSLQLNERDRPQSIGEWRREIVAPTSAALPAAGVAVDRGAAAAIVATTTAIAGRDAAVATNGDTSAAPRRASARAPVATAVAAGAGALVVLALVVWAVRPTSAPAPLQAASSSAAAQASAPQATTLQTPAPPMPSVQVASVDAISASSAPVLVVPSTTSLPPTGPGVGPPASRENPSRESRSASPRVLPAGAGATVATPLAAPSKALEVVAVAVPARLPVATPTAAPDSAAGTTTVTTAVAATVAPTLAATTATPTLASTRRRDEQLDAGEAALRRGDAAGAANLAAPWAAAGVSRAQALLGRAQEARSRDQHNDFEAYVWYGIAARAGEPGAQALMEKVAGRLQPAEVRQAEQIIERWKPRPEPAANAAPERTAP